MGFLDSDTVIVDAILTKYGRKKLARGQDLNINYFALSDEGVDYNLWNNTHPSGSDYYDDDITAMPLMEVVPNDGVLMRYKLFNLPEYTSTFGKITLNDNTLEGSSNIANFDDGTGYQTSLEIVPSTNGLAQGVAEDYIFRVNDRTGFTFEVINPPAGAGALQTEDIGIGDNYVPSLAEVRQPAQYVGQSLIIGALEVPNNITCHISIEGFDSGAITTFRITNVKV